MTTVNPPETKHHPVVTILRALASLVDTGETPARFQFPPLARETGNQRKRNRKRTAAPSPSCRSFPRPAPAFTANFSPHSSSLAHLPESLTRHLKPSILQTPAP